MLCNGSEANILTFLVVTVLIMQVSEFGYVSDTASKFKLDKRKIVSDCELDHYFDAISYSNMLFSNLLDFSY